MRTGALLVAAILLAASPAAGGAARTPTGPVHGALATWEALAGDNPIARSVIADARAALAVADGDAGAVGALLASRGADAQALKLAQSLAADGPQGHPAVVAPVGLVDGARLLAASHGTALSASAQRALASVERERPDLAGPIAAILAAHLARASASRDGPGLAGLDAAVLRAAQSLAPVRPHAGGDVEECGVLALDLTGEDSVWACDFALSIDLRGDDVYLNNAGGATAGAATLVDVAGYDTYSGTGRAVHGAGAGGAGLLVDLGGNDVYVASAAAANGASIGGVGRLVDGGGDDRYEARCGPDPCAANGAAIDGTGTLLDLGGRDSYVVIGETGAANGAALGGLGVLFDRAGEDAYEARFAANASVGGSGVGGTGVLVDAGGSDSYVAALGNGAAFGAGLGGTGILLDLGGTNTFRADFAGAGVASGAGAAGGAGVLLLGPGDDSHVGEGVAQGAGASGGVGILMDAGGFNDYASSGGFAQGAGRDLGVGLLADHGALATFALSGGGRGQGDGAVGAGVLLRTNPEGRTTYGDDRGPATVDGAGVGLRIDLGAASHLPLLVCEGSRQIAGVIVESGAAPAAALRLCAIDRSTAQPVPLLPFASAPKPAIACDGVRAAGESVPAPLCAIDWPSLLAALAGGNAPGWIASEEAPLTVSGGLSVSVGRRSLDHLTTFRARAVGVELDRVCDVACSIGM